MNHQQIFDTTHHTSFICRFIISETEHPPDHDTIIIEANIIANETEKTIKIDNFWRHRILSTCGDANVNRGKGKHVDPALCLYHGARFICITDNKALSD